MTVIHLGEVIWLAAARDEGDKEGEMLWRWLALGLQAPEPAISYYLTGAPGGAGRG
jgi:hypothetical protein